MKQRGKEVSPCGCWYDFRDGNSELCDVHEEQGGREHEQWKAEQAAEPDLTLKERLDRIRERVTFRGGTES